jgi:hypothetical protein
MQRACSIRLFVGHMTQIGSILRRLGLPAGRVLFPLAAMVVGAILLAQVVPTQHKLMASGQAWDLMVDHRLAGAFRDGYNPYSPEGGRRAKLQELGTSGWGHPPTTAVAAAPLANMTLEAATQVVGWLSVTLLLLSLVLLARDLKLPGETYTAWLAFAFLLYCPFMAWHLKLGQLSVGIACAYIAAWRALRTKQDVLAGIVLGAACGLKYFPGVMFFWLVSLRRWRAAAAMAAVFLAIAGLATARFGTESWMMFAERQGPIADTWMANVQNQSIHGIVLRGFFPTCVLAKAKPMMTATLISVSVSLVMFGLAAWRTARARRNDQAVDLSFALFAVLSSFTSQWAWEHYNVIFFAPLAILFTHARSAWAEMRGWNRIVRPIVGGVVITVMLATWLIPPALRAELQNQYRLHKMRVHTKLHLVEVANWIPVVALILVLGWWLWTLRPRGDRDVCAPVGETA